MSQAYSRTARFKNALCRARELFLEATKCPFFEQVDRIPDFKELIGLGHRRELIQCSGLVPFMKYVAAGGQEVPMFGKAFLTAAVATVMGACVAACGDSQSEHTGTGSGTPLTPTDDGITLTSSSPQRLTGVYADNRGDTVRFDVARVNDDLYADVTGNGGRPILHIQTDGDNYTVSYMGGALTMQSTKQFVAQARTQAQTQPQAVSTAGLAWSGDFGALTDMLKLPEVAQLPILSRALGVRGVTGSDFPASLVLHRMAQDSARLLHVNVPTLDTTASNGYCEAYPNHGNDCFGMCGPGCTCWSWVCGDCCYHTGCAVHDSWCNDNDSNWGCYVGIFVVLFGC